MLAGPNAPPVGRPLLAKSVRLASPALAVEPEHLLANPAPNRFHAATAIATAAAAAAPAVPAAGGGGVAMNRDALTKLTVPLLKVELKVRGLKVGGKKAELIERLMDSESQ